MSRILFDLDEQQESPKYRQIADTIVRAIQNQTVSADQRLPSSRELAEELEVSRNTVNLAYQDLLAQGFVVSHERKGIFITPGLANPDSDDGKGRRASSMRSIQEVSAGRVSSLDRGTDRTREDSATAKSFPHVGQDDADDSFAAALGEEAPSIEWETRLQPSGDEGMVDLDKPKDWNRYPFPFIVGQVNDRDFPSRAWQRSLREALYPVHLQQSLMDRSGLDDEMLVEMVRTRLLPSRGIEVPRDQIMITMGTQHGMHLVGQALLKLGSRVRVEDPGYPDAWHILHKTGAEVIPHRVDDQGVVVPDDLVGTDLLLLTPSHHCPTNVTLSRARRIALLERARQSSTVILEDDYDAEFRYSGRPSPSLKALDSSGQVVHLGSFSKFLAPGLRLGFLVGPPPLVDHLRREVRYTIRHVPGHMQRAMALLLESGDYHRALRLHRQKMRSKWQTLTRELRRIMPVSLGSFPPGGVSLWCQGPENLDAEALREAALAEGVILEPGYTFFADPLRAPGATSTFRLGFGAISPAKIRPGVEALRRALDQVL